MRNKNKENRETPFMTKSLEVGNLHKKIILFKNSPYQYVFTFVSDNLYHEIPTSIMCKYKILSKHLMTGYKSMKDFLLETTPKLSFFLNISSFSVVSSKSFKHFIMFSAVFESSFILPANILNTLLFFSNLLKKIMQELPPLPSNVYIRW